jgi:hypothetical protein
MPVETEAPNKDLINIEVVDKDIKTELSPLTPVPKENLKAF